MDLHGLSYAGKPILGAIKLTMSQGETLALVGPSGVGKTTLLRVIAGLEDRVDGVCAVAGRVGMVFQEPTLLPWRNLRDNLCITTGIDAEQAQEALRRVGLAGRDTDYPAQLSLGQQRRLSLARAFAIKPSLLLLDEPFVSLDPETVNGMIALFGELRRDHKVATILVTHVEAEAAHLADRIVTLGGTPGKIVSDVVIAR